MKYHLIVLFSFFSVSLFSQEAQLSNSYPPGIYLGYKSFLSKDPSSGKTVEARNVFKPKEVILDPLIDNCYFYYKRTGKRVKDAFAISYNGSLYIRVEELQKYMEKKDSRQRMDNGDSFVRVLDQGTYLYMEGYIKKGRGIGLAIGGGPISIGTGGPREELRGIIYDTVSEGFDMFRDCQDFNAFLRDRHPLKAFDCDQKQVPIELVRKIMFDINDGL